MSDLSNNAFEITFDHSRVGTYNGIRKSHGTIFFSVDQDTDYYAAGSYTTDDPDGRTVCLRASVLSN